MDPRDIARLITDDPDIFIDEGQTFRDALRSVNNIPGIKTVSSCRGNQYDESIRGHTLLLGCHMDPYITVVGESTVIDSLISAIDKAGFLDHTNRGEKTYIELKKHIVNDWGRLAEVAERLAEGRYDVLYHGTSKSNLYDILSNGLDPGKSQWEHDEIAFGFEPPHHLVYLSPSLEGARDFAPGGGYSANKDPKDGVVLAIRLPEELQDKLITTRGEFIRAPFVIPPQFIEVIED
jgi:hypothetical protein